ncbi:unnamed protein product [Brugia timori]|uniref:Uncharacterized protein n=1 Tax=Brugia timori TaxID=42155 RepID=A0A3P7ZWT4_9BILA|nr:unnamed protein product [Brugia timori]
MHCSFFNTTKETIIYIFLPQFSLYSMVSLSYPRI